MNHHDPRTLLVHTSHCIQACGRHYTRTPDNAGVDELLPGSLQSPPQPASALSLPFWVSHDTAKGIQGKCVWKRHFPLPAFSLWPGFQSDDIPREVRTAGGCGTSLSTVAPGGRALTVHPAHHPREALLRCPPSSPLTPSTDAPPAGAPL